MDAALLDAGGVLVLPDPAVMLPPLRAAGADPSAAVMDRAHYAAMSASDSRPTPDWNIYRRTFARTCGVPEPLVEWAADRLAEVFDAESWTRIAPGALDALRALSETGVGIGVVSNAAGRVEAMLAQLAVCQVGPGPGVALAVIADSHVLGWEKPDPRIFRHALGVLGVPPERCVHVGDTLQADVRGAEGAGLWALHLDPFDDCRDSRGHGHLSSLADLVAWVRGD